MQQASYNMRLRGIVKYCASCGEKKQRLTYPKYEPVACTMRCAANAWDSLGWGTTCNDCGELNDMDGHECEEEAS